MSFILDALKKLEQKRQQGSVPDLMTVHLTALQEPKKRPLLPYLIVLIVLINAGILAALLLPGKPEKQEIVPEFNAVQQESSVIEKEGKDAETALHASPALSETEKAPDVKAETFAEKAPPEPDAAAADTVAASVGSAAKEQPVTSETVQSRAIPEEQEQEIGTAASIGLNPSVQEMEILRNTIKKEYASIDNAPPAEILSEEEIEPDAEKKVLEFDQIPSDIKKELPAIAIKAHIYSNSPSSRIVNVNGIIIREGNTVTAGLKVEEITMTGVVFDYKGLRFLIRAF